MNNAMFDQLKKAGLIDKSKAHTARVEKKQRQQGKDKSMGSESVDAKLQAKRQRDKALQAERKQLSERKAIDAQIKQIVETHRQSKGLEDASQDRGVKYNFVANNKVKYVLVSEKVHRQLSLGQLAIVKLGDNYELVPAVIAGKIHARDPDYFVFYIKQEEADDKDPYKDYKVPDDLTW